MRMVRVLPFFCLLLAAQPGATGQADTIAGTYSGRYRYQVWRTLELQIRDNGNGRISGIFTFSLTPNPDHASYSMTGQYDVASRHFHLEPQKWVGRRPSGFSMVGMEGSFDPRWRQLRGTITNFNCGPFELAPAGTRLSELLESPPVNVPPERRKSVTLLNNEMPKDFAYWDSSLPGARCAKANRSTT